MNVNDWEKTRGTLQAKILKAKSTIRKVFTNSKYENLMSIKNNINEKSEKKKASSTTAKKKLNNVDYDLKNYQHQHLLKNLLKEFGVGQYLRKFYELGYDDNNISKIGTLTNSDMEDLILSLKIFPGHRVKILSLFDKIRKIFELEREIYNIRPIPNLRPSSNSRPVRSAVKRGYNTTMNFNLSSGKKGGTPNSTMYKTTGVSKHLAQTCRIYSATTKTKAPKSSEPKQYNNKMINSFVKGEGLGFNFYLNDYDSEKNSTSKMSKTQNNFGVVKKDDGAPEEIDKLLNYYMKEMNNNLEEDDGDSSMNEDVSGIINNNLNVLKNPKDSTYRSNRPYDSNISKNNDQESFSNNFPGSHSKIDPSNKMNSPSNFSGNNSGSLKQLIANDSLRSDKQKRESPDINLEKNFAMPIIKYTNNNQLELQTGTKNSNPVPVVQNQTSNRVLLPKLAKNTSNSKTDKSDLKENKSTEQSGAKNPIDVKLSNDSLSEKLDQLDSKMNKLIDCSHKEQKKTGMKPLNTSSKALQNVSQNGLDASANPKLSEKSLNKSKLKEQDPLIGEKEIIESSVLNKSSKPQEAEKLLLNQSLNKSLTKHEKVPMPITPLLNISLEKQLDIIEQNTFNKSLNKSQLKMEKENTLLVKQAIDEENKFEDRSFRNEKKEEISLIKKQSDEDIMEDNFDMINEEVIDDVIFNNGGKATNLNAKLELKVEEVKLAKLEEEVIESERSQKKSVSGYQEVKVEVKTTIQENMQPVVIEKVNSINEFKEEVIENDDFIVEDEDAIEDEVEKSSNPPKNSIKIPSPVEKAQNSAKDEDILIKKVAITQKKVVEDDCVYDEEQFNEEVIDDEIVENQVKEEKVESVKIAEIIKENNIKEVIAEVKNETESTLKVDPKINYQEIELPKKEVKQKKEEFERLGEAPPEYITSSDRISKKKAKTLSPETHTRQPIEVSRQGQPQGQGTLKEMQRNNNQRYDMEEGDFEHIRINRSFEENEARQNIEQFDIEYMCRCLGLALMKHIESSKEKFHILDVMNPNEKFDFFNSVYNINIDFFNTFYNLENKMSNLERIEQQESDTKEFYANNKFFTKDTSKENPDGKDEFPIPANNLPGKKTLPPLKKDEITSGTFGHIKYGFDPSNPTFNCFNKKDKPSTKPSTSNAMCGPDGKLAEVNIDKVDEKYDMFDKHQQDELEREMKAINDYFKNNSDPKMNRYMKGDLSQIKEEDSMDYCTKHGMTNTIKKDADKKNLEYINLMTSSMVGFLGVKEEDAEVGPISQSEKNLPKVNIVSQNEEVFTKMIGEKGDYGDDIIEEDYEENFEDYGGCDVDEAKDQAKEVKNVSKTEEITKVEKDNSKEEQKKDIETNTSAKFSSLSPTLPKKEEEVVVKTDKDNSIAEDIKEEDQLDSDSTKQIFESGMMESNYIIDIQDAERLKGYLFKMSDVYDDEYSYATKCSNRKTYIPIPDPNVIFDFCANIMIMTKMEKEVIIISLIYIERFLFNTGILINSRNWKRLIFTALVVASKIWDDDSFENNHFVQVFTHIKIGEINLMERTFLELVNYKVHIKCSEYFKYFFIIKSIALKYNFNGLQLVPISMERMMKLQEYAYQVQRKYRKRYGLTNSATF